MKTVKKFGRYPWVRWFASGLFTLRRGRDYACRTTSMISWVYRVARDRGAQVEVLTSEDGQSITVIVRGKEDA